MTSDQLTAIRRDVEGAMAVYRAEQLSRRYEVRQASGGCWEKTKDTHENYGRYWVSVESNGLLYLNDTGKVQEGAHWFDTAEHAKDAIEKAKTLIDPTHAHALALLAEVAASLERERVLRQDLSDCIDVLQMCIDDDTRMKESTRGGIVGCINVLQAALAKTGGG